MKGDATDPKALIREAYRIDGIGLAECRSIFMDWALSLPEGETGAALLPGLLAQYSDAAPDHPMTQVLREGLAKPQSQKRRGGWRGRRAGTS